MDIAVAVAAPLIAVMLGNLSGAASGGEARDWYRSLNLPWFAPPGMVFGVAWTILYVLIGLAFWRLIRLAPGGHLDEWRRWAIGLFVVQLLINLAWNPAFFQSRSPLVGVVIILPLLALIALTVRASWMVDRKAGLLLLPYLVWVVYATILAVTILILN
jgi:translocator protein